VVGDVAPRRIISRNFIAGPAVLVADRRGKSDGCCLPLHMVETADSFLHSTFFSDQSVDLMTDVTKSNKGAWVIHGGPRTDRPMKPQSGLSFLFITP
jgi:hypothetical protein